MSQENHDPAQPERRQEDEFQMLEQLHEIRKKMIETAETILQYVLNILLRMPQVLSCLGFLRLSSRCPLSDTEAEVDL